MCSGWLLCCASAVHRRQKCGDMCGQVAVLHVSGFLWCELSTGGVVNIISSVWHVARRLGEGVRICALVDVD